MPIPRISSYAMISTDQLPENKLQDNGVEWQIDISKCVLLVHDMQSYFVDFFDREQEPVLSLIKNIQQLITSCKELNIPVAFTAQPGNQPPKDRALLSDFWGPGLADDPSLTQIIPELTPDKDHLVFEKWRYSAFKKNNFQSWMSANGKEQIILCGVYAHIGLLSTALDAFMEDIQVHFVGDAVADFSESDHLSALNYVSQRCAWVTNTHSVVNSLKKHEQSQLSIETLKSDLANILHIDPLDVENDDNLMYLGLDSIRLMTLIEKWRTMGVKAGFADFAEYNTLEDWWRVIREKSDSAPSVSQGLTA